MLLFDFLESMIYYKDAENLLLRARQVKIAQELKVRFSLNSTLTGEPIDLARHRLRVDVKAVTLHRFKLEKTDGGGRLSSFWISKKRSTCATLFLPMKVVSQLRTRFRHLGCFSTYRVGRKVHAVSKRSFGRETHACKAG